jgi:hypothetical protein
MRKPSEDSLMSLPDDVDPEALISRLAGPLSLPDKIAFRRAAEDALTRVPCWGEGAVYRAVAALQRAYFHPPPDERMPSGPRHQRASKLIDAPALAYAGDQRHVRYRKLRVV